jgi:hypothetical protein
VFGANLAVPFFVFLIGHPLEERATEKGPLTRQAGETVPGFPRGFFPELNLPVARIHMIAVLRLHKPSGPNYRDGFCEIFDTGGLENQE